MKLLLDIGNTNTVLGLYEGGTLRRRMRVQTRSGATPDELWSQWRTLLEGDLRSDVDMLVASVVPELTESVRMIEERYLERPPRFLEYPWKDVPVEIGTEHPDEVGADRVAGAVALHEGYGPGIVVDFGTATTVDVVVEGGIYRGGVILPGVQAAAQGLASKAAKLPVVSPHPPDRIGCGTTEDALQSGLFYGIAGGVERVVHELRQRFDLDPNGPVVATGGQAHSFKPLCEVLTDVDPDLVLTGILLASRIGR